MNETIRTQIAALEDLRLPELQARYAEVLGEPTRTPNRRFLIRRITEALLALAEGEQPAPAESTAPSEPTAPLATETVTQPATVSASGMDVEEARRVIMENVDPMGYDTAEQYVEECYGQVAPEAMPGLLVEAAQIILDNAAAAEPQPERAAEPHSTEPVIEPAPAAEPAPESAEATEPAEPTESATAAEPASTPKLTKLDVPALQALHLELIGRPTASSDKAYLVWRLRQAQKGKIPVGPREHRATTTEPQDHKVLPLRMEAELVAKLDEARERLGLKSRMDLFRRALHSYLTAAGEQEVADLFAPEA